MWKLFKKLFEEENKQQEVVTAPRMTSEEVCELFRPGPVPEPPKKWREPVQVLIDSLKDGWWDLEEPMHYYHPGDFYLKHEWFGTEMWFHKYQGRLKTSWHSSEKWLSVDELEAVGEAVLLAVQVLKNRAVQAREKEFFKLLDMKEI